MFQRAHSLFLAYSIIGISITVLEATVVQTKSVYLWTRAAADKCPPGTEVPQDKCLDVLRGLVPDNWVIWNDSSGGNGGNLNVGSWSFSPCGCFIGELKNNDLYFLNYDTKTTGCAGDTYNDQESMIACTVPPPQYSISSLHMWPRNLKDRCPVGHAVSQDNCLNAGRALVPDDKPLKNDFENNGNLYVNTASHVRPCGCVVWENVDDNLYKIEFHTKTTDCKINNPNFANRYSRVICDSPPPCFITTCEA